MSTVTPLIEHVHDLWPDDRPAAEDPLSELVLASHLLGANRAVSNFGGGNTSAKGTTRDHVGREVEVVWVKGSGSDLATMREGDFTGLRLHFSNLQLRRVEAALRGEELAGVFLTTGR